MRVSKLGERIAKSSGIGQLMDDLGYALNADGNILMLGGGNPAHIAEVEKHLRQSVESLLNRGNEFERAIGEYDPPQGNRAFIEAVCNLLNEQYSWGIVPENVALTNGSQSAFFILCPSQVRP